MKHTVEIDSDKHNMKYVRQNELEDIYICKCGLWVKVPRGCDIPLCPHYDRDHATKREELRRVQWNGSNVDDCNAGCKHLNVDHYEEGFSEILGRLAEFWYCEDCGLPSMYFREDHPAVEL